MRAYDAIILGGGLSGLSLALTSAEQKVLVLESRSHYVGDRTWCFWNVEEHPFEKEVQYRWNRWQVRANQETTSLTSSKYQYHCIPSNHFYKEALKRLQERSNVTLLLDTKVIGLQEEPSHVTVETTKGTFTCSTAYDSRPCTEKSSLYQHFHGWEIECHTPLFDPEEVILMDFDVSQKEGLHFIYLLPFSSTKALVESTFISPHILPLESYEKAIKEYLKTRYQLDQYVVNYKETGALPLRPKAAPRSARIVPIGARGGWMRASTGYAFLSTQRRAKMLTEQPNRLESYLDSLFLSYLKDYPEKGPELFFNLFKKNRADCMVQFLSGKWSYQNLLRILISMPKLAMIKQALK